MAAEGDGLLPPISQPDGHRLGRVSDMEDKAVATLLLELLGSTMIRLTPGTISFSGGEGFKEGNVRLWSPTSIGLVDEEVCLDSTVLNRPGHAEESASYYSDLQTAAVKDDNPKYPNICWLTYLSENLIMSVSTPCQL